MRVSSVSGFNYNSKLRSKKQVAKQQNQFANNKDSVNFKGVKGAAAGTVGGLLWLGALSLAAGPLLPFTIGFTAMAAGAGALAGHTIEEEFNKDDDDDDENKNG